MQIKFDAWNFPVYRNKCKKIARITRIYQDQTHVIQEIDYEIMANNDSTNVLMKPDECIR